MASRDCDKNAKFVTQRPLMGATPHLAAVKFLVLSLFHARCSKIQKLPNLNSKTKLFDEISSQISSRKLIRLWEEILAYDSNKDFEKLFWNQKFRILFLKQKFCFRAMSFKFLLYRK